MSKDPIEEDGGLKLYGFVYNSPLNFWDMLGLEPEEGFLDEKLKLVGERGHLFGTLPYEVQMGQCVIRVHWDYSE